jgi:hypothetical protein
MEEKRKRPSSPAQRSAVARYNAANTKQYPFRINLNTDQDILEKLEKVSSVAGYIKQLIREDIQRGNG